MFLQIPAIGQTLIITPPLQLPNKLVNELTNLNICPKNQDSTHIPVSYQPSYNCNIFPQHWLQNNIYKIYHSIGIKSSTYFQGHI